MEAEPVTPAKIAAKSIIRNAVAVVSATLPPVAMLGLPVACAMLFPHLPLLTRLHAFTALTTPVALRPLLLPVPILPLAPLVLLPVPVLLLYTLLLLSVPGLVAGRVVAALGSDPAAAPLLLLRVMALREVVSILLPLFGPSVLLLIILFLVPLCIGGSRHPEKKKDSRTDNYDWFHEYSSIQVDMHSLNRRAQLRYSGAAEADASPAFAVTYL